MKVWQVVGLLAAVLAVKGGKQLLKWLVHEAVWPA